MGTQIRAVTDSARLSSSAASCCFAIYLVPAANTAPLNSLAGSVVDLGIQTDLECSSHMEMTAPCFRGPSVTGTRTQISMTLEEQNTSGG
jgi:hypothetical protein